MKFLLDSCISFFAVKDLREEKFEVIWIPETGKDPGDEVIRLVDIPAKNQGKILLGLIRLHKRDIEQGAIITVDKYRVRIRYIYE